ncbi:MAG: tetratricopeptide repeat protein [Candidatus Omnitrophota bacterium]
MNAKFFLTLAVIIILGIAVYANSLNGEFIWDDEYLVKENVFIRDSSYIPDIFSKHIAAGSGKPSNSYRPLQILSYMSDFFLWKLDWRGYHITNIILHILAALSIYWFINILYDNRSLSFLTSALFVVHPIHTESVSYISGRADLLALLFMLLSFIFYIKYAKSGIMWLCVCSILSFAAALLSKESSLILPALLLLYHYNFKRPVKASAFSSILIAAVAYILLRFTLLKSTLSFMLPPSTAIERIPGFFVALTDYIRLLILPLGLHMEYGDSLFKFTQPKAIAGLLIIILLLAYVVRKKEKAGLVTFSISWFFITLMPVSNIYPINAYMAEHWLYMPSIGFFLITADLLRMLCENKKLKRPGLAAVVSILIFYSLLTMRHNRYWRDPLFFYERTQKYALNNLRVYNNLGAIYYNKGRNKEAVEMYNKALEINPNHIEAYNNLGVLYFNTGEDEKALAMLNKAIRIKPDYAQAHNNLGNVYLKKGMLKETIYSYKRAISINPNYSAPHYNIAAAYFNNGDHEQAIIHCDKAIALGHRANTKFITLLQPYRKGTQ